MATLHPGRVYKVRKREPVRDAIQVKDAIKVATDRGVQTAHPGDWVVGGDTVVPGQRFEHEYTVAGEEFTKGQERLLSLFESRCSASRIVASDRRSTEEWVALRNAILQVITSGKDAKREAFTHEGMAIKLQEKVDRLWVVVKKLRGRS